jgi:hypothetical protein
VIATKPAFSEIALRAMRRAIIYLRVSTLDQTTANQERELREIASRMGCEIVKVYRDHGISGAKGRDKRPAFDKLCRDAARGLAYGSLPNGSGSILRQCSASAALSTAQASPWRSRRGVF